jgi:hypothetical protein
METKMGISELVGKTLTGVKVKAGDDEITFTADDGTSYLMHHDQDCCETVNVDDICGDLGDIIGSPIIVAEERVKSDEGEDVGEEYKEFTRKDSYDDGWTWTFYTLRTIKGTVTIRWYGSSNGYYSESVDFVKCV